MSEQWPPSQGFLLSYPAVFVIGGPNGAGKTTTAKRLLPSHGIDEYVNADAIAAGLSPLRPAVVEGKAGRLMLERFEELAKQRINFAFEATLSGQAFAARLRELRTGGYTIYMAYIWLRHADLAVQRVRQRVESGGHSVPEHVVRRRFNRSAENFMRIYRPLAEFWLLCDNSTEQLTRIADGSAADVHRVYDEALYESFRKCAHVST
ncbi:MAG: zeta toxin family protein [Phycisphaeraceae bacterium]|nr:zeta toxin family protein [Phycisphaeraceae bacterium]